VAWIDVKIHAGFWLTNGLAKAACMTKKIMKDNTKMHFRELQCKGGRWNGINSVKISGSLLPQHELLLVCVNNALWTRCFMVSYPERVITVSTMNLKNTICWFPFIWLIKKTVECKKNLIFYVHNTDFPPSPHFIVPDAVSNPDYPARTDRTVPAEGHAATN